MNILFLTNNEQALPLAAWLTRQGETVTVHYDKLSPEDLLRLAPDLTVSYSYQHIIRPEVVAMCRGRIINLHISCLPWNRGADPNFWSFMRNTPKGVTIHVLDDGLDTGDILFQKILRFDEDTETLSSTYAALQKEIQELFIANWPVLRAGTAEARPQRGPGSFHKGAELLPFKKHMGDSFYATKISELKDCFRRYENKELQS